MSTSSQHWDLLILDGAPPARDLGSLAVGDVDGDGHVEIVTAGSGALLWYRPATVGADLEVSGGSAVMSQGNAQRVHAPAHEGRISWI